LSSASSHRLSISFIRKLFNMLPRDRLLNSGTALGERYVHKSLPTQRHILPGNWNWKSTATADYLVRETTWLTSLTGGTSPKYVLAYRYQLEDGDLGGEKVSMVLLSSSLRPEVLSGADSCIYRW
jgi:hypothetical protein